MRRTIEEILTLYELEPTTRRDIYVEGVNDRDLIAWYLEKGGSSGRSIFCIGDIEVPSEKVVELGLGRGSNRNRVVALAMMIWDIISPSSCRLIFIVDRDLSDFVLEQKVPFGILKTDFSAADCYLLNEELVVKFLRLHCKLAREGALSLWRSIVHICEFLFALRVVVAGLCLNGKIVGVAKLLELNSGNLKLDNEAVIRRTLSDCGVVKDIDLIELAVDAVLDRIATRTKYLLNYIHGHDAIYILGEVVHICGDSAYREENRVRRSLFMGLQIEMIKDYLMFRVIG